MHSLAPRGRAPNTAHLAPALFCYNFDFLRSSHARLKFLDKLRNWFLAFTSAFGGVGIFCVAFLDSSVLTFPVATDLLVIQLSVKNPARMPFYALMATLGSLGGCVLLYYLAKKGGEVMFRKSAGRRAERIRDWVDRNAFLSVAIPSVLPPPMPFKVFVIAAGVFQMNLRTFVVALMLGRGFRYFAEGILAVKYGQDAWRLLKEHRLEFVGVLLVLIFLSWLITRYIFRPDQPQS